MRRRQALLVSLTLTGCATAHVVERLNQEDVHQEIVARRPALEACTRAYLAGRPEARHGKLLARFVILPSGLAQPDEAGSEGPPEFLACVLGVIADTRFPPHRQPAERVTYPMLY